MKMKKIILQNIHIQTPKEAYKNRTNKILIKHNGGKLDTGETIIFKNAAGEIVPVEAVKRANTISSLTDLIAEYSEFKTNDPELAELAAELVNNFTILKAEFEASSGKISEEWIFDYGYTCTRAGVLDANVTLKQETDKAFQKFAVVDGVNQKKREALEPKKIKYLEIIRDNPDAKPHKHKTIFKKYLKDNGYIEKINLNPKDEQALNKKLERWRKSPGL
jgi:hypothetical protein